MTMNLILLLIAVTAMISALLSLLVLAAIHGDRRPHLQPPPGSSRPLNEPGWRNW